MTTDEPTPEPASDPLLPHPDAVPFDEAGTEERPLPPPSILESVLTELLGAVPEVKDHVLEAADALLDAAKALIDAADRVVRQQRGDEIRPGVHGFGHEPEAAAREARGELERDERAGGTHRHERRSSLRRHVAKPRAGRQLLSSRHEDVSGLRPRKRR